METAIVQRPRAADVTFHIRMLLVRHHKNRGNNGEIEGGRTCRLADAQRRCDRQGPRCRAKTDFAMSETSPLELYLDLRRLRDAAAWRLLAADTSPTICACLLSLFPASGARQLGAAALSSKLDTYLESLRSAGVEPSKAAIGYAADWVASPGRRE